MGSSEQVSDPLASSNAQPAKRWTTVTRVREGRVLGGVCAGVARAFGLDPIVVRILVVALLAAGGSGALLYVAGWLILPQEGTDESLAQSAVRDRRYDPAEIVAVAAVVLGVLLLLRETGLWFGDGVVWPVLLAGVGLAVIWRQAGDDDRQSLQRVVGRLPAAVDVRGRRAALARVVIGVALVVGGVASFLAASDAFSALRQGLLATAGIVAGVAVITGPWWVRMGRDLTRERRERIRSEERAEVAAHLHDSVLQTLALIQRNADDPRTVVTMARRQERELRSWLYRGDGPAGAGAGAAPRRAGNAGRHHHPHRGGSGDRPRGEHRRGGGGRRPPRRPAGSGGGRGPGGDGERGQVVGGGQRVGLRRGGRERGEGVRAGLGLRVRPGRGGRRPPRAAGVDHRADGPPRRPGGGRAPAPAATRPTQPTARAPRSSCGCPDETCPAGGAGAAATAGLPGRRPPPLPVRGAGRVGRRGRGGGRGVGGGGGGGDDPRAPTRRGAARRPPARRRGAGRRRPGGAHSP